MKNLCIILAIAVLFIANDCDAQTGVRTWTSVSGKTYDREFVKIDGDQVVWKDADGKRTRIKLEKLSPKDQKLAQKLQTKADGADDDQKATAGNDATIRADFKEYKEYVDKKVREGDGIIEVNHYSEKVPVWKKAAERGNAEAQVLLGLCYNLGDGIRQDCTEAVKWYRKVAEQGRVEAQVMLGACYGSGMGVAKDYTEAIKWWQKRRRKVIQTQKSYWNNWD